jgi:hypothetical protein
MSLTTGLMGVKAERDDANVALDGEAPPVLPAQLVNIRPGAFVQDVLEPFRIHIAQFWKSESSTRSRPTTATSAAAMSPTRCCAPPSNCTTALRHLSRRGTAPQADSLICARSVGAWRPCLPTRRRSRATFPSSSGRWTNSAPH